MLSLSTTHYKKSLFRRHASSATSSNSLRSPGQQSSRQQEESSLRLSSPLSKYTTSPRHEPSSTNKKPIPQSSTVSTTSPSISPRQGKKGSIPQQKSDLLQKISTQQEKRVSSVL